MSRTQLMVVIVAIAAAAAAGYWLALSGDRESGKAASEDAGERKPLYYRNPMNPTVTSPVPAKDSMGMDYVPVYADDAPGGDEIAGTVSIDPVVTQNIGVRTAMAERSTISRAVRAVGRIDYDEKLLTRLHPKVSGWIEELYVDTTGEQVEADQILLSLYSPRLVASQEEYVLALKNFETLKSSPIEEIREGAQSLLMSSRARLELFDVPEHQIEELEERMTPEKYLHIHAPRRGVVVNIGARPGQHISPATEIYMIADLSKIWAYADIFEYEIPWVSVGDEVEMTLAALPGQTFTGTLDYIYPYAEANTRTIKVRLSFDNPDLLLRPDMFAEIVIRASRQQEVVVIPSEAVVRSGSREQVFVAREAGKFEPRLVELGIESDGRVAVLSGVMAGESVVTSSQFLIDSESKLREAAAKMTEVQPSDVNHGNMDHGDMDQSDMDHGSMEHSDMKNGEMDHSTHEGMDHAGAEESS